MLAEAAVSDLYLRLSEEPRLLLPRWSQAIWEETRRIYIEKLGWNEGLANSRIAAAQNCFPEAMVTGFDHLIPACTNHPDDKHVLAAAIHSRTFVIVTFNVRDFKSVDLEPWGITASHPADYLKVLFDHDPAVVTTVLHAMSSRANRTMPEMLARLAWYVRPFSEYVAGALAIELPVILPQTWRR